MDVDMEISDYCKRLDPACRERYLDLVKKYIGKDPYLMKMKEFSQDRKDLQIVEAMDITSYLVLQTSHYTREQMKAHKSLEAYNFYQSCWISKLGAKHLNNNFVLLFASLRPVWGSMMNQMGSQGSVVNQKRRLVFGVVILLLVDVIWVASSELTSYIFKQEEYNKPFFSTFAKTSMFILYLLGFLVWRPWTQQCSGGFRRPHPTLFSDAEECLTPFIAENGYSNSLSESLYVPVKFQDSSLDIITTTSSDCEVAAQSPKKSRVRFSNIMEVRQLPSNQALEAKLSRMSYGVGKDQESLLKTAGKLTVSEVAKISFFVCFVWFLANFSYQQALSDTEVAIVNILSSTSGLFTLILAAIFPSSSSDRFTLSKLLAVALSIGGVALVSVSSIESSGGKGTFGTLWSLAGAALYAVYIVMIKRKVDREGKMDIPMFFGFLGLFNLLFLWPGFLLLHYTGFEAFELPSNLVCTYILINGLIGTVLSEFLWLWGCFLTSSLIGTLALSLTIPLSIIADMFLQKVHFSWMFFVGSVPVFLSFFTATLLCHYNNWDPVTVGLRRMFAFICRKKRFRLPEDSEQTESLIPLHTLSQAD